MDSSVYDIYFQGEALEGFDINLVKQNMAKLFQANAQTLAALFSGKTVLLKKDLGKDEALKYQTLLKKAGARIVIKARKADLPAADKAQPPTPPATQAVTKPATAPPTPATRAPSPPPTAPVSAGAGTVASGAPAWSLSPAGADLLKPEERHAATPVQVDTSKLSVAAPSPLPQVQKTVPPPPDTSGISIAAVGTVLGTGDRERINAQAVVPDVNFDIAEVGARLADETIEIPLPEPDLSQLSLAAVGSRLGTESKEPPPKAPDTSHLSVAPQK